MSEKYYASWEFEPGSLICDRCGIPLEPGEIVLHYMGNDFPMIVINLMIELGLVGRGAFILLAFIVSVILAIFSYHTTGALYRKTSCH
jgi:hypothetical protein